MASGVDWRSAGSCMWSQHRHGEAGREQQQGAEGGEEFRKEFHWYGANE